MRLFQINFLLFILGASAAALPVNDVTGTLLE